LKETAMKLNSITIALAIFVFGMAGTASAQINLYDPNGIAFGTQYQLIFVTSDTTAATSSAITTYDAFVQSEAALNPVLAALNTTWTVVGSTNGSNAKGHSPSTGLVFNLNGDLVADSADPLYGGSILNPVDFDENGAARRRCVDRLQ